MMMQHLQRTILLIAVALACVWSVDSEGQVAAETDTARFYTPWGSEYLFFTGIDTLDTGYTSPALFYEVRNYAEREAMLTWALSKHGAIEWEGNTGFASPVWQWGGGPHVLVPFKPGNEDAFDYACLRLLAIRRDWLLLSNGLAGIFSDPQEAVWIGPVRRELCRAERDWGANFATAVHSDSWGRIKATIKALIQEDE